MLFQTQSNWARADDYLGALKQLGKLGGLTDQQMDACFADEELTNRILQSRLDAQNQYEISSTPTFVIDGKTYTGAREVDEFAELIDPLLEVVSRAPKTTSGRVPSTTEQRNRPLGGFQPARGADIASVMRPRAMC